MKEFKFRAFTEKTNKMDYFDLFNGAGEWLCKDLYPDTAPDEIMQYTGLLDKNGVEIYEGDIVKEEGYSGLTFEVKWNPDSAGYYMPKEYDEEYSYPLSESELEIIGNVYENKELLNGKN